MEKFFDNYNEIVKIKNLQSKMLNITTSPPTEYLNGSKWELKK